MIGALLKRAPQRFFLEKRFNEINLKSFGQTNLDKGRVVKQTETAVARQRRGGAQRHGGKPRNFTESHRQRVEHNSRSWTENEMKRQEVVLADL